MSNNIIAHLVFKKVKLENYVFGNHTKQISLL